LEALNHKARQIEEAHSLFATRAKQMEEIICKQAAKIKSLRHSVVSMAIIIAIDLVFRIVNIIL